VSNNTGYENVSFTDIEGGVGRVDTTIRINLSITYSETMPAGEGRLYRVAPVVKYGGRLFYSEAVSDDMELLDDMIIENGATLTIYDNYIAKANIIVKNGFIINGDNGKINFAEGKKLIIDGYATITGTTGSKLELIFTESQQDETTGIQIKESGSLTISNCKVVDATIGIQSLLNANYLNAQNVDFINCITHSISIAGRSPGMNPTPLPQINGCTMQNSNYGILVTNLPGLLIQNSIITNTDYGIYLSNVTTALVINNQINANTPVMQGIFASSSGGVIRGNQISGHTYGIHLANSASIDVGGNDITDCLYHGMYIGSGSNPNMVGNLVLNLGTREWYATAGYNKIYNNGGYSGPGADNDGSEIYFYNSNARMRSGCNSIYDNRQPSPPLINTLLLMNGYSTGLPLVIQAQYNFWGDTVYAARFGGIMMVFYSPYYEYECTYPDGGEDELVLKTQFGEVIDTLYSTGAEVPELTATEEDYAEAEGYFLTGDLTNALQVYEGIISSNATEEEKYLAYERKYAIGKLTGQTTEFFNEMSNSFSTLASNTQDTLDAKILNQLSALSKVGEQEYETAISEFDNIVQQNPNTEEAVYAEIDALTTALLIEEADSTLQKGRLGKYLIKSSADYNQRVDEILRKHFGSESKETEEEILPTEYTLYQNYPNPFNPTTTIKYDLPSTSDISLIIYDILGRKVKELVNTKQQAGRYEVQFNASNLSSGVYIYQLIADNPSTSSGQGFISSKKMILLK
jgi:parallel beta-helix repeat protein